MKRINDDPLSGPEIDLSSLHLLRLVARFRGFTAASKECGLSQSALTRQVQSIESRLGIKVFDRTTRTVTITEAGAVLLRETEIIPNILKGAIRRIREDYLELPREIRIGISHDLALAHLPGIFHAQRKLQAEVKIVVSQSNGESLLKFVANADLDLGILTLPANLPSNLSVTHRMTDQFSIIVTSGVEVPKEGASPAAFRKWVGHQTWLLPPTNSRSRQLIDDWAGGQKIEFSPAMELENFDTMIHLVSMRMGAAFVPRRSLSLFRRKRRIQVVPAPITLSRQLIVVSPKHTKCPEHVAKFVEGILFS